jgi:hypothetical protein
MAQVETDHRAMPPHGATQAPDEAREAPSPSPDRQDATPRAREGDSWLSFAIPISIAIIAILGAVVGYRIERHAANAAEFDHDALAASITTGSDESEAVAQANESELEHDRWLRLVSLAGVTAPHSSWTPAGGCELRSYDTQSLIGANDAVACELQQVFAAYGSPSYDVAAAPAQSSFDVRQYVADVMAWDRFSADLGVGTYVTAANRDRHEELRVLLLSLALVAALALCTLAQLSHHRRFKLVRPLWLAVPGWLITVAAAGCLLAWEL